MKTVKVLSLGGSIIVPDKVDVPLLRNFKKVIDEYLAGDQERKLIIVTGGGAPARDYQQAYREAAEDPSDSEQDWIGIAATHLNGRLLKALFHKECAGEVVSNPVIIEKFEGRVLIAGGWKPGFSSDHDAVLLAEKFGADTVINLSNIEKVYTADPRIDPDAQPLDTLSWNDFIALVGDEWVPGKNVPFDPVAAQHARKIGLTVICAAGRNPEILKNILEDKPFEGTIIGPG